MGVYVSHTTALWLRASPLNIAPRLRELEPLGVSLLQNASASIVDIRNDVIPAFAEVLGTDGSNLGPMDVLVDSDEDRHSAAGVRKHLWKGALPKQSFDLLTDGVFLATPEFSYQQLACVLDDIELLRVGYAMCGYYWPTATKRGFVDHTPLTDTFKLREYLALAPRGLYGLARARRVADLIIDNARSPMEAATAMVLSLKQSRGGWGAPRPELNVEIPLDEHLQRVLGKKRCFVDLYWPKGKYAIEYNGEDSHPLAGEDIKRQIVLEEKGLKVQLITKEQITDISQSFILANRVRRFTHNKAIQLPQDVSSQLGLKDALLRSGTNDKWRMPPGYR